MRSVGLHVMSIGCKVLLLLMVLLLLLLLLLLVLLVLLVMMLVMEVIRRQHLVLWQALAICSCGCRCLGRRSCRHPRARTRAQGQEGMGVVVLKHFGNWQLWLLLLIALVMCARCCWC